MITNGAWIFLSHSSNDIEKVRKVRNAFEEYGHNPLAFHLRCMQTTTKKGKEELDELIKREIDARQWFVFCESPSAAMSPYVKMEREYILESKKRKVWSIDMSLDMDQILERVRKISRDLMIFVDALYPYNYNIAHIEMIEKKLADYEYTIVDTDDEEFEERGFIIYIICKNDLEGWRFHNLMSALESYNFSYGKRLIPVLVGNFEDSNNKFEIEKYDPICISSSGKGIGQIIERIDNNQDWITSAERYMEFDEINDTDVNVSDEDLDNHINWVIDKYRKLVQNPRIYVDSMRVMDIEIRKMVENKLTDFENIIINPNENETDKSGIVVFLIRMEDAEGNCFQKLIDKLDSYSHNQGGRLIPVLLEEFDYSLLQVEFDLDEYAPITISDSGDGFDQVIDRIDYYRDSMIMAQEDYGWVNLMSYVAVMEENRNGYR